MTVDLELADRFVAFVSAYCHGESHAMTSATVLTGLGLTPTAQNRRELRACAQHASKAGHLICSSHAGYFVPVTPEEVLSTSARLRSEASELWKRAKRVDQLAAERFDLTELPEPEPERPALFTLLEAEC